VTLGAALAHADWATPPIPHAFYGNVTLNGVPAPVGTSVEARGEGVQTGIAGNPITTGELGKYGGPGAFDQKLVVQGGINDGTPVTFYVNGVATGQTAAWHSGDTTELDLSVTIAPPPPPPPAEELPALTMRTNLFGMPRGLGMSSQGVTLEPFTATSGDGRLTVTIPAGTTALDQNGNPLATLEAVVDESPPAPPEGAHIIGLAYDFDPFGATFAPPITFTWRYDPPPLPEGVVEEDLVIAYYDSVADQWVELDGVVDTENNTVTASVAHLTCFALIGAVPPPEEEEVVPPEEEEVLPPEEEEVLPPEEEEIVPPEEEEVLPPEEEEVLPPEEEEIVPPEEEEVPPPEEEEIVEEAPGISWPMVGGIIGGVAVVALLVFFFLVRRRTAQ
jgi:hypothetical protein